MFWGSVLLASYEKKKSYWIWHTYNSYYMKHLQYFKGVINNNEVTEHYMTLTHLQTRRQKQPFIVKDGSLSKLYLRWILQNYLQSWTEPVYPAADRPGLTADASWLQINPGKRCFVKNTLPQADRPRPTAASYTQTM